MTNYSLKAIGACLVCLSLFAVGCDSGSTAAPQQKAAQEVEPPVASQTTFNTTDKSINTNGNVLFAVSMLPDIDDSKNRLAVPVRADVLTKSPYSSLGKLIRIKGEVFKVEEMAGSRGTAADVLLLTENKNNPMGVSTVDFVYSGDFSKVNSGDIIWVTGFFVGTYESQNAMGGMVEGLAIVGNKITS